MDAEARQALEREMRALSAEFAGQLPRRLLEIESAWRESEGTAWSGAAPDRLYRLCHSLAGAGGTFGFNDVGQAARGLTDWMKAWRQLPLAERPPPRADLLARLGEAVRAVRRDPPS